MHKMLTSVFMLLLTEFVVATPEVQPILKSGSCPVGYYTSGNYCVPSGKLKWTPPSRQKNIEFKL